MVNVQEWVNKKYSTKEEKAEVRELYLSEPSLAGQLDLSEFTYQYGFIVIISSKIAEEKIVFKNKPEGLKIFKLKVAQKAFVQEYPFTGSCLGELDRKNQGKSRSEIVTADLCLKNLECSLVIHDFSHLETIYLNFNRLTSLEIINCPQLKEVNCQSNNLSLLPTLAQPELLNKLDISMNQLANILDLNDFTNLEEFDCRRNQLAKLTINNRPRLTKLSCAKNQLTSLSLVACFKLERLDCSWNQLTRIDFLTQLKDQLVKLNLSNNQLTASLDFSDYPHLQELNCAHNKLTSLAFTNSINLTTLYCSDNNLSNLASFNQLVNLKKLNLSFNNFTDSLKPLKNLTKLENLNISNTNIDSGLEYLPTTLERFNFKDTKLANELDSYDGNWKLFLKDQQITFLQQDQTKFIKQQTKIDYLQSRIQELTYLNKELINKIFISLSQLLPERELLGQLIQSHLQLVRYKSQGSQQSNYSKKKRQYERETSDLKDQLEEKLAEELMNKIEAILNNFEKLIEQEVELEAKLTEKQSLITEHQQTAWQIQGSEENRIVRLEREKHQLQAQELISLKQAYLTLQLQLATEKGKLETLEKIASLPRTNQGVVIIDSNNNQFSNTTVSGNTMNLTICEEESETEITTRTKRNLSISSTTETSREEIKIAKLAESEYHCQIQVPPKID